MGNKKGAAVHPSALLERMDAAIAKLGNSFTISDVRRLLFPRVPRVNVTATLCKKTREGILERVGRGRYRWTGRRLTTRLPNGLAAEATWAALFTSDGKPMRLSEITEEAETYIDRAVSLRQNVCSLLHIWTKRDALVRTGTRGEYAYRVRDDVTEQPIANI